MSNNWIPQHEIDTLVARVRVVVDRFGGQSDALANLRKSYEVFYECPDVAATIILKDALQSLEEEMKSLGLYPR